MSADHTSDQPDLPHRPRCRSRRASSCSTRWSPTSIHPTGVIADAVGPRRHRHRAGERTRGQPPAPDPRRPGPGRLVAARRVPPAGARAAAPRARHRGRGGVGPGHRPPRPRADPAHHGERSAGDRHHHRVLGAAAGPLPRGAPGEEPTPTSPSSGRPAASVGRSSRRGSRCSVASWSWPSRRCRC